MSFKWDRGETKSFSYIDLSNFTALAQYSLKKVIPVTYTFLGFCEAATYKFFLWESSSISFTQEWIILIELNLLRNTFKILRA